VLRATRPDLQEVLQPATVELPAWRELIEYGPENKNRLACVCTVIRNSRHVRDRASPSRDVIASDVPRNLIQRRRSPDVPARLFVVVDRMIAFEDFEKVDIRVGRIIAVEEFPHARKPAYKLLIDFGPELGTKRSSAQLTRRYARTELEGRLVIAVVNFPPRQIGPFVSDVLTLGVPDADGAVVLLAPDADVPLGARMF
jgi:tRNA-binding protein